MSARRTGFARVAVLLLIGTIAAAAVSAVVARAASRNVSATLRFQHAVAQLWSLLIDTETQQRGFIITADTHYFTAYEASVADLRNGLRALKDIAADKEERSGKVAAIVGAVETRVSHFDQNISDYRAHRPDAITSRMRADEPALANLRQSVADLQSNEETILEHRQVVFTVFENVLFGSIILATLISIVLFRLQGQMMRDNIEALEKGAAQLKSTNSDLEAIVAARTADLSKAKKRAEELADQLTDNLRRFDLTLRSSSVIAFTQDRDLRFTWISRDAMEHDVFQIVGKAEDANFGQEGDEIIALKRHVLETGVPTRAEVAVNSRGQKNWYELRIEPMRDEQGIVTGLMGVSVEITERRERESKIQLLLREITHRSKNLLAVIQSMARQTAVRTVSPTDFVNVFSQRIQSLALSHDLLLQSDWAGAPLRRVLQAQLAPFAELIGTRIEYDGPDIYLKPEAAQGLGMAIHELVTNAAKFGALSVPSGKIQAIWCLAHDGVYEDAGSVRFEWRERDMPKVMRPERRGFGHVVLESATARALSGTSQFTYASDGATWRLDIPVEWITSSTVVHH